eukprot:m.349162 g.349162  ORF g.349162 m.349162 type:complete len:127 (-) comp40556_c0_seq1:54-434(-)
MEQLRVTTFAIVFIISYLCDVASAIDTNVCGLEGENLSVETKCAEEDNVDVRFTLSKAQEVIITAIHGDYKNHPQGKCSANFTNCNITSSQDYSFTPKSKTMFDNGVDVLQIRTEAKFWLQQGVQK